MQHYVLVPPVRIGAFNGGRRSKIPEFESALTTRILASPAGGGATVADKLLGIVKMFFENDYSHVIIDVGSVNTCRPAKGHSRWRTSDIARANRDKSEGLKRQQRIAPRHHKCSPPPPSQNG